MHIRFIMTTTCMTLLLLLYPATVPAQQDTSEPASEEASLGERMWNYLINGASITVGIGAHQTQLSVTEKSTGREGVIAQRDEEAYFIGYSTRPQFIRQSNFGYTIMLNYTAFTMDEQEVSDKVFEDVGTRIRGKTAYVVPTLFYQLGRYGRGGAYARLGIGLGLGVEKFSGTIILDYPSNTIPVSVSNGSYDLKIANSVFLEGRYRGWGITITAAGPSYEDENYTYNVSNISSYLAYTYYF